MRQTIAALLALFFTTSLFGQNLKKKVNKSPWKDTTFILVKLNDTIVDNKVAAFDIGKKAIIYAKLKPMMLEARANLSNHFVKDSYQKIINFFDSALLRSDTILVSEFVYLPDLDYLLALQLIAGNANVYYKKQKTFVDTISHRLERYGGNADRFFYLPDKRPFFAIRQYSGILDGKGMPLNKGRYQAYYNEGEKLQSLRQE